MQIVNRVIFDSTTPLDGAWQDVSLMPSWSLHVTGLENNVWVEASNDPAVLTDGSTISAPSAPSVSSVPATSFNSNPGTYTAKVTYLTPGGGETTASGASSSQVVAAGNTLQVASPAADAGGFAVGYSVYISLNGGPYIKQNQTTLKIGNPFTLVTYSAGPQPPTANTGKQPGIGVALTPNLGALTFATTPAAPGSSYGYNYGETQIAADTGNGNQAMISTSCLVFKYIRVRKSSGNTKETVAYLMGQNG